MPKIKTRSSSLKQTLHDFIRIGDFRAVRTLISRGVDINMKENDDGSTPLHVAVKHRQKEIIKLLLSSKAAVDSINNNGETALALATDLISARILIEAGANVNHQDKFGWTALHSAIKRDHIRMMELLVSHCANVNIDTDFTPLHATCWPNFNFNKKKVKFLIKNNAKIDAEYIGSTPLMSFLENSWIITDMGIEFVEFEQSSKFFSYLLKYFDINRVECAMIYNDALYEIYFQHVAKFLALDMPVYSHHKIIANQPKYKDCFKKCTDELVVAKSSKLPNSWVTYFNLLVDNKRKLKNYAGNNELIQNFKKNDCCLQFPIYGNLMKENVERGIQIRILFDKSAFLLSIYLPIFDPTHLIVRDVLDHLGSKDLSKLCINK